MTHSRLERLTSWYADWKDLRVAVLGLGVTGFSVADTLAELGAQVLVVTADAAEDYQRILPVLGVDLLVDALDGVPQRLTDFEPELLIASPGFAPGHTLLRWAEETGLPVWGDVELAWRVRDKVTRENGEPAEWILLTGVQGVAATASLTASLLRAGGERAAPCGDIGVAVLDAVRDPAGFDALVIALSERQLWYLQHSAEAGQPVPHSTVCLQIGGRERGAYGIVYRNTRVAALYNKGDVDTRELLEEADVIEGARAIGFDLGIPGPSDLGVVEGLVVDRAFLAERARSALELITLEELQGAGVTTAESALQILAACGLARAAGVLPEAIHQALSAS